MGVGLKAKSPDPRRRACGAPFVSIIPLLLVGAVELLIKLVARVSPPDGVNDDPVEFKSVRVDPLKANPELGIGMLSWSHDSTHFFTRSGTGPGFFGTPHTRTHP